MKCSKCGESINSGSKFCSKCGSKVDSVVDNKVENVEGSTFGWGVLGFFIPLVGLILFFVWMNSKPKASKSSGIGALIGFVIHVLIVILCFVFFVAFLSMFDDFSRSIENGDIENYLEDVTDYIENDDENMNAFKGYSLGDSFEFDDFSITFGKEYSFDTLTSDSKSEEVIKIPVTIVNTNSYEKMFGLNNLECYFGNSRVELVGDYFDNSIEDLGLLEVNKRYDTYIYFTYKGEGSYSVRFAKLIDKKEVTFYVKK